MSLYYYFPFLIVFPEESLYLYILFLFVFVAVVVFVVVVDLSQRRKSFTKNK
jgi:hypothetical protein